jgi:hypothetical protein
MTAFAGMTIGRVRSNAVYSRQADNGQISDLDHLGIASVNSDSRRVYD